MKKITEMTDAQVVEIALLALEDHLSEDGFISFLRGGGYPKVNLRIERGFWDDKNKLPVIRIYSEGEGDTHCAIWENSSDQKDPIDVTVDVDKEQKCISNFITIATKLKEWGYA